MKASFQQRPGQPKNRTFGAVVLWFAEKEGFEPSDRIKRSTVFETAPFDHSGISPWIKIMKFKWILQPEKINNIRKIHRRLQPHAYHDPKIILRQIYGAMSRGIIII